MPEIDLGIGVAIGTHSGLSRSWLYWYDAAGRQLPAPENVIAQERQRAEQERQRAYQEQQRAERAEQQVQALIQRLQQQGIDPENLSGDVI
jgi:hypothetical protein